VRRWVSLGVVALGVAAGLAALHAFFPPVETLALDDRARAGAGGDFIALDDGIVHYELAGPEGAPAVVFVHGFSTPYLTWDFQNGVKKRAKSEAYGATGRWFRRLCASTQGGLCQSLCQLRGHCELVALGRCRETGPRGPQWPSRRRCAQVLPHPSAAILRDPDADSRGYSRKRPL
jgi:hypothetical protein